MARRISTTMRGHAASVLACLLLATCPPSAGAAVIRLDTSTPGASVDAVIDGFPGIAPLDGTADVGGNALAVGLKAGVTEERGIVELPLAPLAGVTPAAVTSAILTFNVDDVLSTFGPGTDFDGTAAERIIVKTYPGDGQAALDDFGKGTTVGTVNTGGPITDASLASSGPVRFTLDVTGAVKSLLGSGATHLGIVFATDDSPTGTSLDDLGPGGAGPPGVGNATMPFVTVNTAGNQPTPTPGGGTATPRPSPTRTPSPQPTDDLASALFTTMPDGRGDQLIYVYDARDGFTTFLNLHNASDAELVVSLLLYGPDFGTPFTDTVTLAAGTTRTLDVGEMRDRGLPAQFGVAFATVVDPAGRPIVTRSIAGNFTVANLTTGSAWGAHAAARAAVELTASGIVTPDAGVPIDGETVLLRAIRPDRVSLATYYDPATLQDPEQGGNQLIFVSFNDVPGESFSAEAATTRWRLTARRNDGEPLAAEAYVAGGVDVSHLEAVLGEEAAGRAGSVLFTADPSGAYNRLVFFTEALGTFATGYLLPHVAP
jgi:hypothetical protein